MVGFKAFASLVTIGLATAAVPAHAVLTTFATFAPLAADLQVAGYSNMRWLNNGTNGSNGTGGSVFSVNSNAFAAPAATRQVSFSFLPTALAPVATNITANFTWNGSTPLSSLPTLTAGTLLTQGGISGTFSFISTAPITVGSTFYATGSNLLSGTFGGTSIIGNQGSPTGAMDASTALGQTVVYTSDFLDFSLVTDSAYEIDLDNIRSTLSALQVGQPPTRALRTFRSSATGGFGVDGDLIVNGIPEPQTWGLMIVGFGMVGLQVRRRNRQATVTA